MTTVVMNLSAVGGTIQASFGTYIPGSDGTATVDVRDAVDLLRMGGVYLNRRSQSYNTPGAVAAATGGAIHASGALANGAITITAQPDVQRQVAVRIGTGSPGITAGSVAVTYLANDGLAQTDTISAITAFSTTQTQFLSKGVEHINTIVCSGLVGGTTPFIIMDTTTTLSVPVDPGAQDFVVTKANVDAGDETVGTLSTTTLGSLAPNTAPNATHTFGFAYSYITADT